MSFYYFIHIHIYLLLKSLGFKGGRSLMMKLVYKFCYEVHVYV